ncbi:hypothetical protein HWN39_10490 [Lactobacillus rhamnosus]|uniref:Lipoprotein n=1 Tax=Lacticaseibacillus rhamnosus TaxID=47715 RepID=A0A7Y7QH79_LACRH|nr:hypothetical protein [Lacticaseibacillus rhamnosus]NVO88906.1 hypothetical protein [Lacticaseibacillus rhamnosus]
MKKLFGFALAMLASVSLSACGNTASSDQNSSSASVATVKSAKSQNKANSGKEVTNGPLLHPGEWTDDSDRGKAELKAISNPKQTITSGTASIIINDVKFIEVTPRTDDQKQYVEGTTGASNLTTPYYQIQVDYQLKNNDTKPIQFNGIKSVVLGTGEQIDGESGMYDSGSDSEIAANATKASMVVVVVNKDKAKLNKVTLNFDTFVDKDSFDPIADAPAPLTLTF